MGIFRRKAPLKPPPIPAAKAPAVRPASAPTKPVAIPLKAQPTTKPLATSTTRPPPQLSEDARRALELEQIHLAVRQRDDPGSPRIQARLAEIDRLLGPKKWPPKFDD